MSEENSVKISFNDIYWEIHAEVLKNTNEKEPIVELSWGWDAGIPEEILKDMAEDAPSGHESVRITMSQAIRLRDKLNEIIK